MLSQIIIIIISLLCTKKQYNKHRHKHEKNATHNIYIIFMFLSYFYSPIYHYYLLPYGE